VPHFSDWRSIDRSIEQKQVKQRKAKQPKPDAHERKLREEIALIDMQIKDAMKGGNRNLQNILEQRKARKEKELEAHLEVKANT
jgi:hypothetical protein